MKTISELNNKSWYRLVKVIFVLGLAFSYMIAVLLAFSDVGDYDNDYTVKCNEGNMSSFLANKDKGIDVYYEFSNPFNFENSKLSGSAKRQIRDACGIENKSSGLTYEEVLNGTDDTGLYDMTYTKVFIYTYTDAVIWSLVFLVAILIVSQFIRRTFYYVVLGKIYPPK